MIYIHEQKDNPREGLIFHWANEVRNKTSEGYDVPTYKVLQVETGIIYDSAVDVMPCKYTYEATEEPIEPEPEPEE